MCYVLCTAQGRDRISNMSLFTTDVNNLLHNTVDCSLYDFRLYFKQYINFYQSNDKVFLGVYYARSTVWRTSYYGTSSYCSIL